MISGSDFISGATVTIGGAPAPIVFLTETQITAVARPHAPGIYEVLVSDPAGNSTGNPRFESVLPPVAVSSSNQALGR